MACTDKCKNATSVRCRCSCNGANHGQNVLKKAKKKRAMKRTHTTVIEKCKSCIGTGIVEVCLEGDYFGVTCPRCDGAGTVNTLQVKNGGVFEEDEIPF